MCIYCNSVPSNHRAKLVGASKPTGSGWNGIRGGVSSSERIRYFQQNSIAESVRSCMLCAWVRFTWFWGGMFEFQKTKCYDWARPLHVVNLWWNKSDAAQTCWSHLIPFCRAGQLPCPRWSIWAKVCKKTLGKLPSPSCTSNASIALNRHPHFRQMCQQGPHHLAPGKNPNKVNNQSLDLQIQANKGSGSKK